MILIRARLLEAAAAGPVTAVSALDVGGSVGVWTLVGDGVGVVARTVDGEAGDSGRRNGELRGDPKDKGDGLNVVEIDCKPISTDWPISRSHPPSLCISNNRRKLKTVMLLVSLSESICCCYRESTFDGV